MQYCQFLLYCKAIILLKGTVYVIRCVSIDRKCFFYLECLQLHSFPCFSGCATSSDRLIFLLLGGVRLPKVQYLKR